MKVAFFAAVIAVLIARSLLSEDVNKMCKQGIDLGKRLANNFLLLGLSQHCVVFAIDPDKFIQPLDHTLAAKILAIDDKWSKNKSANCTQWRVFLQGDFNVIVVKLLAYEWVEIWKQKCTWVFESAEGIYICENSKKEIMKTRIRTDWSIRPSAVLHPRGLYIFHDRFYSLFDVGSNENWLQWTTRLQKESDPTAQYGIQQRRFNYDWDNNKVWSEFFDWSIDDEIWQSRLYLKSEANFEFVRQPDRDYYYNNMRAADGFFANGKDVISVSASFDEVIYSKLVPDNCVTVGNCEQLHWNIIIAPGPGRPKNSDFNSNASCFFALPVSDRADLQLLMLKEDFNANGQSFTSIGSRFKAFLKNPKAPTSTTAGVSKQSTLFAITDVKTITDGPTTNLDGGITDDDYEHDDDTSSDSLDYSEKQSSSTRMTSELETTAIAPTSPDGTSHCNDVASVFVAILLTVNLF